MRQARTAENCAVKVVPNAKVRMEVQHSIPRISLHYFLSEREMILHSKIYALIALRSKLHFNRNLGLRISYDCDSKEQMFPWTTLKDGPGLVIRWTGEREYLFLSGPQV